MSTATKKAGRKGPERMIPTHPDWLYLLGERIMHPDLCFITSQAVGHLVMLSGRGRPYAPASGYVCQWKEFERKVIHWREAGRPDEWAGWKETGPLRGERFWDWWVRQKESVQDTPERACIAYVIAYKAWVKTHPEKP
jgi:hypothetical protein